MKAPSSISQDFLTAVNAFARPNSSSLLCGCRALHVAELRLNAISIKSVPTESAVVRFAYLAHLLMRRVRNKPIMTVGAFSFADIGTERNQDFIGMISPISCFCSLVAGGTKGNKVVVVVCFLFVTEQAKRLDMVDIAPDASAVLTITIVACSDSLTNGWPASPPKSKSTLPCRAIHPAPFARRSPLCPTSPITEVAFLFFGLAEYSRHYRRYNILL